MEARKLITDNIFYNDPKNPDTAFLVAMLDQDKYPIYGLVGTLHNRFAFMPIEGAMIIVERKYSLGQFKLATKLNKKIEGNVFVLFVCYEAIRLGYIGKAAISFAVDLANSCVKDNFTNGRKVEARLINLLKDVEEPLHISNANEKIGNSFCPICNQDELITVEKRKDFTLFDCNCCNTKFKYNYEKELLTVPGVAFAEVLETLNDLSTTFVL